MPEEIVEKVEDKSVEPTPAAGQEPQPEVDPTGTQWSEESPPQWVRDRLRESTEAKNAAEQQLQESQGQMAQLQAARDQLQRQVHGLVGVEPPTQNQTELDEVRKIVDQVYPDLGNLSVISKRLEDMERRQWRNHANDSVKGIFSRVQTTFGAENLSQQSQDVLEWAFIGFVQSSEQNQKRYEQGDATLYDDFHELVDKGMIAPSRQSSQAKTSRKNRLNIPTGGEGGGITTKSKEPDNRTLEQRVEDSAAALMEGRDE